MPIIDIYNSPLRKPFLDSQFSIRSIKDWHAHYVEKTRSPEGDLICFYYLYNSILELERLYGRYTSLGEKEYIVERYIEYGLDIGEHLLIYLVFICLRETRHAYLSSEEYSKWAVENPEIKALINILNTTSAQSSLNASAEFLSNTEIPTCILLEGISSLFVSGCFNSSCGGAKWKVISDLLLDYVQGNLTLEMCIDLSFNVEHNTSNIFNKGFLYSYSKTLFKTMLTMQYDGHLPFLVEKCSPLLKKYLSFDEISMLKKCELLFPLCSSSTEEVSILYPVLGKYIPKSAKVYGELYFPIIGDLSIVKR